MSITTQTVLEAMQNGAQLVTLNYLEPIPRHRLFQAGESPRRFRDAFILNLIKEDLIVRVEKGDIDPKEWAHKYVLTAKGTSHKPDPSCDTSTETN